MPDIPRDAYPVYSTNINDNLSSKDLLMVEASACRRGVLQRILTIQGFRVIGIADANRAYDIIQQQHFEYAVIGLGVQDKNALDLIKQLKIWQANLRIVIVTDSDSFASVVVALRAGADDYVAELADGSGLIDALMGRSPMSPPVPSMPLGLSRVCWEHIMRIHEQCGRNVSMTAERLGMHRRSLQRILGKRAPEPRAAPMIRAAVPVSRFRRQHADSERC